MFKEIIYTLKAIYMLVLGRFTHPKLYKQYKFAHYLVHNRPQIAKAVIEHHESYLKTK